MFKSSFAAEYPESVIPAFPVIDERIGLPDHDTGRCLIDGTLIIICFRNIRNVTSGGKGGNDPQFLFQKRNKGAESVGAISNGMG